MRPYGLRILVALLTFAIGVAVSSLFFVGPAQRSTCGTRVVTRTEVVATSVPLIEAAPPTERRPEQVTCGSIRERTVLLGGVLNGKAVSKPLPSYPPEAKTAGLVGTVVVRVVIDVDGSVSEAEAQSGPKLLQDAAVEAARLAKFSPTLLSGCPVKVSGVVTYNFWPH